MIIVLTKHASRVTIFCQHQYKVYFELSYSPELQILKCILSQELSLQRSPKFGIDSHRFETNAQRPGRARPLNVTSFRLQDFVLVSMFVLEVMAGLQPYRFEPERVPDPEDSER